MSTVKIKFFLKFYRYFVINIVIAIIFNVKQSTLYKIYLLIKVYYKN